MGMAVHEESSVADTLSFEDVRKCDWKAGSVEHIYILELAKR